MYFILLVYCIVLYFGALYCIVYSPEHLQDVVVLTLCDGEELSKLQLVCREVIYHL